MRFSFYCIQLLLFFCFILEKKMSHLASDLSVFGLLRTDMSRVGGVPPIVLIFKTHSMN